MSTQPPPPPNQPPYGQSPSGGQQPPSWGSPPGGQPPGGPQPPPYGGPPPGPQPPPYGPPPRKGGSSKALIAVILIVALVVAGGAVGGFLLFGGDDDDGGGSGTATELSGETVEGEGYSYPIPEGWADDTEEVGAANVDSVVRAEEASDGFRTNVLVEVHPAQGTTDLEEIRSTWESNVASAVDGTPEQIDSTSIDGVDAVGLRIESTQQGNEVVQVAYLTISDDKIYSIAMSTGQSTEEDATATFNGILDGWKWQ